MSTCTTPPRPLTPTPSAARQHAAFAPAVDTPRSTITLFTRFPGQRASAPRCSAICSASKRKNCDLSSRCLSPRGVGAVFCYTISETPDSGVENCLYRQFSSIEDHDARIRSEVIGFAEVVRRRPARLRRRARQPDHAAAANAQPAETGRLRAVPRPAAGRAAHFPAPGRGGCAPAASPMPAAAQRWVSAVNADGQYGQWAYRVAWKPGEVKPILDRVG